MRKNRSKSLGNAQNCLKLLEIAKNHRKWLDRLWNHLKHENYISNSEWNWKSYSYNVETVTSVVRNNLQFSQLIVTFEMQRNDPFFSLTLFIPILILTVLAPIGLILPGKYYAIQEWISLKNILVDAGEKMGLQITVLLSDIIYVDILQSTVPVFDSFGNSPLILRVALKLILYSRLEFST